MFFDKHNYLYLLDFKNITYICFWAAKSNFPDEIDNENFSVFASEVIQKHHELLRLVVDQEHCFNVDNVIACNDVSADKAKNFRKNIYQDYKSNRKPPNEWFVKVLPIIEELFMRLKIPVVSYEGYEADDLIGSYSRYYTEQSPDNITYIVSGDKDFFQLVNNQVYFKRIRSQNFELYKSPHEVYEKVGVTPQQFIDYLAIVGDSADCIPGAKGIGPKGAQQCLQICDNLENLKKSYTNIGLKKNIQEKLSKSWANIDLSKGLATIVTDLDVDPSTIYPKHKFQLDSGFNPELAQFLKKYALL